MFSIGPLRLCFFPWIHIGIIVFIIFFTKLQNLNTKTLEFGQKTYLHRYYFMAAQYIFYTKKGHKNRIELIDYNNRK